jgi:hypothetical protein
MGGKSFYLVDMPGVDDTFWHKEMELYVDKHKQNILPMFIIDLTQGTAEL